MTANPQYKKFEFEADSLEHFWQSHWDERRQTVLPEPVLDRVTEHVSGDGPPVIAHLQQPHWPYVARIEDNWELAYPDLGPWTDGDEEIAGMQVAMARGKIDVERAYNAYRASVGASELAAPTAPGTIATASIATTMTTVKCLLPRMQPFLLTLIR